MVKSKIVVIGDAPLVTGFQLAGLENTVLTEKQEFEKTLEEYMGKSEFGIIVVNENMLNEIDWRLRKKIDSVAYPVVVPIPDISGQAVAGDEIRNLIKRALGFDLGAKK
ncbi:V-type ATP synthase subunit F [Candidatus Micrarchaeota archaeon]|nr:V-type ATP synthase subunit F [Candidatus Micrarchaeota archaeon]